MANLSLSSIRVALLYYCNEEDLAYYATDLLVSVWSKSTRLLPPEISHPFIRREKVTSSLSRLEFGDAGASFVQVAPSWTGFTSWTPLLTNNSPGEIDNQLLLATCSNLFDTCHMSCQPSILNMSNFGFQRANRIDLKCVIFISIFKLSVRRTSPP